MSRGLAAALLLVSGCIAPAQSIGAIDDGGTGVLSSAEGGVSTTLSASSSGTDPAGSESSTTGPSDCAEPCIAFHDCQQARCVDGECLVSFRDALCDPGEACGASGCEAAPLRCDDAAVLVCEGFESDGFAPAWGGGAITRTQAWANTGAWAGEVSVGPDEREHLGLDLESPLAEGMVAIRSFVRIPAADFVEQWIILYEVFGSANAGQERWSVDLRPSAGLMYVNLLDVQATIQGNDLLTPGEWACVEVRVQLSDGAGEVELRVNEIPVLTNGPGIDTVPVDGVSHINIGGIGSPDHSGVATFEIDDIVVARAPIGCLVE